MIDVFDILDVQTWVKRRAFRTSVRKQIPDTSKNTLSLMFVFVTTTFVNVHAFCALVNGSRRDVGRISNASNSPRPTNRSLVSDKPTAPQNEKTTCMCAKICVGTFHCLISTVHPQCPSHDITRQEMQRDHARVLVCFRKLFCLNTLFFPIEVARADL